MSKSNCKLLFLENMEPNEDFQAFKKRVIEQLDQQGFFAPSASNPEPESGSPSLEDSAPDPDTLKLPAQDEGTEDMLRGYIEDGLAETREEAWQVMHEDIERLNDEGEMLAQYIENCKRSSK